MGPEIDPEELKRRLKTRMAELATAHRRIEEMKEELGKLRETQRKVKAMRLQRDELRNSPEYRLGRKLIQPFRKLSRKISRKTPVAEPPAELAAKGLPRHISYHQWRLTQLPSEERLREVEEEARRLPGAPLISIVMPVYNTPESMLEEAIESVRRQAYRNWELLVADDASTETHVGPILKRLAKADRRIAVRRLERNAGIALASNAGLAMATGEFVAFLDHDDWLEPDALFEMARVMSAEPEADFIYSDEDKVDEAGYFQQPFFKPDWSPDTLLTKMYTCHFAVFRRSLIEAIGGFRKEFDGAEDYDLVLRLVERTDRIFHIPDMLYSWRTHPRSTATGSPDVKSWAYDSSARALEDALKRRGEPGVVARVPGCLGYYRVRYDIAAPEPVSIVIPTRDSARNLDRCLLALFERTTYPDFEVVVVDNGSRELEAQSVLEKWGVRERARFRTIRVDAPFNHSSLVNAGVATSGGSYLLLLNDDTEVIAPDWLESMVGHAQRPSIGAVGAQLLYRDNTIQHAGIVGGVMGSGGHAERRAPANAPGYFGRIATVHNVAAVTGACLMCRRDVYEAAGGFDEAFDSAYNDIDFCLRLHERGLRNVYVPEAKLYHLESESWRRLPEEARAERMRKAQALLVERWSPYLMRDPFYSPHLTRRGERFEIG